MKRLLALLIGGVGLRALLHRRRAQPAGGPTPADELRTRLAQTRAPEPEPDPQPGVRDVDTLRADVHARARQAMEDLRDSD